MVIKLVPEPVGVPSPIWIVSAPATVPAPVPILIRSTTPGAWAPVAPIEIVRAAAGAMLPKPMTVARVLFPKVKLAVPAVPTPDKIATLSAVPAPAPFPILMV